MNLSLGFGLDKYRVQDATLLNQFTVVSAVVSADNPYLVVVTLSKDWAGISDSSGLALNVNIDEYAGGGSNTFELTVFEEIIYGQELLLSYSGTGIVSVDGDALAPFTDFPVTNNIPANEPV